MRSTPEDRLRQRAGHLSRKYGMTLEQYDTMLEPRGGGCFICGRRPRDDISLHVDHHHSTGRVRGILCFCCNNALAEFREDPALLVKAADYVSRHANVEEIELARLLTGLEDSVLWSALNPPNRPRRLISPGW